MATWSKEHVLEFIEIYRANECLWRVKSKDYPNKLMRDRSYENLVNFVRRFEPGANKDSVIKKINNLRSSFRKELRKIELSQQPGASPDEIHEPKLWYFDLLYFLKDQETPRHSRSNIELLSQPQPDSREYEVSASPLMEQEDEPELDLDLDVVEEQGTEPQPSKTFDAPSDTSTSNNISFSNKRSRVTSPMPLFEVRKSARRKTDEPLVAGDGLRNSRATYNGSTASSEDQHGLFAKYIAQRLRDLPREQRIHAEKLFSDVLYEAELETLNRNSAVVAQAARNGHFSPSGNNEKLQ